MRRQPALFGLFLREVSCTDHSTPAVHSSTASDQIDMSNEFSTGVEYPSFVPTGKIR
jgi:hypothetical protein